MDKITADKTLAGECDYISYKQKKPVKPCPHCGHAKCPHCGKDIQVDQPNQWWYPWWAPRYPTFPSYPYIGPFWTNITTNAPSSTYVAPGDNQIQVWY